jgi:phosphoglycerate dehydrogenase-like enzyme
MQRSKPENTKLTICVSHPFTQWRPTPAMPETLRPRWSTMKVVHLPEYKHLAKELTDTDIFVGYSPRPEQLVDARKLQWIHSTAAGAAHVSRVARFRHCGDEPQRTFFRSDGGAHHGAAAGAEFSRLGAASGAFTLGQQEIWDQPQRLAELNAQVLLIVGYGSIGRELARRATAFDMRVWGVTRTGQGHTTYVEKIVPVSELHQVLPHADFVVIAAPETPETRHLIGRAELARMKPSARVVNVSRGSLLDEMALVQALKEQRLGGAALDVTAIELLGPKSPLWKTPHLMITPHTSAVRGRLWKRQTENLAELLERCFGGRELFNRVDLSRGY